MRKTRMAISTIKMRAVIAISITVLLTFDVREDDTCCPVAFCVENVGFEGFADVCRELSVVGDFVCGAGGSVEMGAITGRAVG